MRWFVLSLIVMSAACLADPVAVGEQVPAIEVTTVDGTEVNLQTFVASEENEGKIVVLCSWSFKCPSGKPFIGYHKELAAWCAEQEVVYLAVSMYGEGHEKVVDYLKTHEIDHTVAVDEGCRVAEVFDTRVVNSAYVIATDGSLAFSGGLPRGDDDLVRQAVLDLKDGNAVRVTSSRPSG